MKIAACSWWLVALLVLSGCGGSKTPENAKIAESASHAIEDPNAGSISGTVQFTGEKPVMKTIDMSATMACERTHSTPRKSEEVVVNQNGTLKNVFIWVKSGVPEKAWPAPATTVKLDQAGCMYKPHMLGVMVNQPIQFTNSDPTNHNIHPLPRVNLEWNESQPPNAGEKVKRFTRPEIMIPVKCNIHPWMRAWIGVVNHPFFAVTGDDGSYKIPGLPPGTYTLEAWHEKYGTKDVEVTVAPKADKAVPFEYSAS